MEQEHPVSHPTHPYNHERGMTQIATEQLAVKGELAMLKDPCCCSMLQSIGPSQLGQLR